MDGTPRTALLGFSIGAFESMTKANRPFLAVVPSEFEPYMKDHNIPFETWDFGRVNEQSVELHDRLAKRGVEYAVPLYEETVEWAGAVNSVFRNDPKVFYRYMLFRDKAMMKRKAQMNGIRVGVFEEAENRDDVRRFFRRVNEAAIRIQGESEAPIHIKPKDASGSKGHRFIRNIDQVEGLDDDSFPCLLETHLDGQEFSCEIFVNRGRIVFMNITEYIKLGYSNYVPCSPYLEQYRPQIQRAAEDLIRAFEIEYAMIHPEFFITPDGTVSFGEVAARIPGGHIFELIEKAYGFDPIMGQVLCCDPKATDEELSAFFPHPVEGRQTYAGCLMVYPRVKVITHAHVPNEILEDPYYEKHNLFVPSGVKVAERAGYGDHYGTIYFKGDEPDRMRELLEKYEEFDFYSSELADSSDPESAIVM